MFSKDSIAGKQVSKILDRESKREQHGMMPIYEEKGVYNFYLKLGQSGSIAPLWKKRRALLQDPKFQMPMKC